MKKYLLFFLAVMFFCASAFADGSNSGIAVGDYIKFGRYEQDNDLDNGPEEIEWLVVEAEAGKCCLVSKYILDAKHYHDKMDEKVNWETCWLRGWLNEEFLQTAFSAEEQALIPVTLVDNDPKSLWAKRPNDTEDRIYLLSYREVHGKYFHKDWDRYCEPTPYAIAQGLQDILLKNGRTISGYFLRVGTLDYIPSVRSDGRNCDSKHGVWYNGVRPVLWMEIKE